MVTYAARVNVHPDRYGAVKSGVNRLFVLHTSEQTSETDKSAESLAKYMESPGDRPNGDGTFYGSSYQYVVDTDQVIPCVPETVVSYSAAGANHDGIHVCFPGMAGQSRLQWLDPTSRAMIRCCAELLVDRTDPTGIPLRQLYDSETRAGMAGVVDHAVISRVYKRSTHTDVGLSFPWDVLWADITELSTPPTPVPDPEDAMAKLIAVRKPPVGSPAHWPWLGYFDNGIVRPLVSYDPNSDPTAPTEHITDPAQYRNAAHAAGCGVIVG
jgi:hypothetical protein